MEGEWNGQHCKLEPAETDDTEIESPLDAIGVEVKEINKEAGGYVLIAGVEWVNVGPHDVPDGGTRVRHAKVVWYIKD